MANGFLDLEFGKTPDLEHEFIVSCKTNAVEEDIEIGARLDRFFNSGDWAQVTTGGPYLTWSDYVERGVGLSPTTAYIYMAASRYPLYAAHQNPLEKLYYLSSVTNKTAADETVEQALAMFLPLDVENESGENERVWVPFRHLTIEQTKAAWNLIRTDEAQPLYAGTPEANAALERWTELRRAKAEAKAKAKKGKGDEATEPVEAPATPPPPPPEVPVEAKALEERRIARLMAVRDACKGVISPGQLKLRTTAGKFVWDMRGVDDDALEQLAMAIASMPKRN